MNPGNLTLEFLTTYAMLPLIMIEELGLKLIYVVIDFKSSILFLPPSFSLPPFTLLELQLCVFLYNFS